MARDRRRTERAKLDATPPWERKVAEVQVTSGPFDERDAPDDDIERIDLGALLIPAASGLELRVEVDPNGNVNSATLSNNQGQMQLGLFAAPRSEGIWDEVRGEIRLSLAQQGGTAQDVEGTFGTELTGRLQAPGGMTPVRFIGVDGPRWFLRAMIVGPAAQKDANAAVYENALRSIVVVRGKEPLPVREPVPLKLPEVTEAPTAGETATSGLD